MSTLDNLPEELLALVLQSCDTFSQLRSLVLTSKRLHDAWTCNQRAILWKISQRAMVSFSDALIAVRPTPEPLEYLLTLPGPRNKNSYRFFSRRSTSSRPIPHLTTQRRRS